VLKSVLHSNACSTGGGGLLRGPEQVGSSVSAPTPNLLLLLIDELQCLYKADPLGKYNTLFGYMKRLKQGEKSLRLRILAAAVFGNSPSQQLSGSALSSITNTPFEYSKEQLVSFHAVNAEEPCLALRESEHNELWSKFWDASPIESDAFYEHSTRDSIFSITAGQASYCVQVEFEVLHLTSNPLSSGWHCGPYSG
jgi:hypothetical protein